MSNTTTEMRTLVSANVRKAMVLQDVTTTHLSQVLSISVAGVSAKLSNRESNHFSEEQIVKLAEYFSISVEELSSPDMSEELVRTAKYITQKYNRSEREESIYVTKDIPIPEEEPVKGLPKREQPEFNIAEELIKHINSSGDESEVNEVKVSIYRSALTGRIASIEPYLLNSLLAVAIKSYQKKRKMNLERELTEAEEEEFADYFEDDYGEWKRKLWPDSEREIQLRLMNNKREAVHKIIASSAKDMPDKWITDMLKGCGISADVPRIDVKKLSAVMGDLINQLTYAKKPLDDYLYDQLNVSGSQPL